jgi:2-polyprenyl-3-methyl-5-hydroxy-6-metoxy-1,4-benzoquinol methylase
MPQDTPSADQGLADPGGKPWYAKGCLVCESARVYYLFSISGSRVVRCNDCGLVFLNPQPDDAELAKIYGADYFCGSESEKNRRAATELKEATARLYLHQIQRYHGREPGRLLEIGCGRGEFLVEAERAGWEAVGVEYSSAACEAARSRLQRGKVYCGQLSDTGLDSEHFDLCVIADVIEHVRNPIAFLEEIHRLLKPGAALAVYTPSLDSWSARLMGQKWMEFKTEHLTYFDRKTIQTALFKTGFHQVIIERGWKILSFDYIWQHFERYPVQPATAFLRGLAKLLPAKLKQSHWRIVASGMTALTRKTTAPTRPLLSIIIPAYNESATFAPLVEAVLRKKCLGVDTEIIIVESNSTDGTRELALRCQNHPRVKLILEDKARGKGHAVRTGLKAAVGNYILIQDADLEYDLEDYDALLEPLLAGRESFVLGSRHGGKNILKMRAFAGQPELSLLLNCGHWFFTTLVNLLFWQRLRDPFTMFKVFRRDCLYGLEFECNRFDFDYELLIKLIRKGYRPVELPVNYRSRPFKAGKKVRLFRDPITWLYILLRLRLTRVDPMRTIERERRLASPEPKAANRDLAST